VKKASNAETVALAETELSSAVPRLGSSGPFAPSGQARIQQLSSKAVGEAGHRQVENAVCDELPAGCDVGKPIERSAVGGTTLRWTAEELLTPERGRSEETRHCAGCRIFGGIGIWEVLIRSRVVARRRLSDQKLNNS